MSSFLMKRWTSSIAIHTGVRSLSSQESAFFKSAYERFHGPVFTVIKVGGEVVEDELDVLVETCATLHKDNLKPIIIHGGGPQMNKLLSERGVEPNYVGGHRVTDEATLGIAQEVFTELNGRVVDAINANGTTQAQGFAQGVFNAEMSNAKELGFVGDIVGINKQPIRDCLEDGKIPVLTSLGTSSSGQLLNINADVAAREMALWIKPMRTFFTSAKGGWIDDDTKSITSVINLSRDYQNLANRDYTGRQGTLLKLNEIKGLLDHLPSSSTVTITSASDILNELYTFKGAGTLFLSGEQYNKQDQLSDADKLLFGSSYCDTILPNEKITVFMNESKDSGAILRFKGKSHDIPTVDRLVVEPSQFTNQLNSIWGELKADYAANGLGWQFQTPSDSVRDIADSVVDNVASIGLQDDQIEQLKQEFSDTQHQLIRPLGPARAAKVGLLGARGYVGKEFIDLLVQHPDLELSLASSRQLKDQLVVDGFNIDPNATHTGISKDLRFVSLEADAVESNQVAQDIDVWVLALPNGLAPPFIDPLTNVGQHANDGTGSLLIDLGADFRFTNDWVYGLPERKGARESLIGARRISNPGCYATGMQIGLLPILQFPSDKIKVKPGTVPTCFGVSGYSGAGTTPSDKNNPEILSDNLLAYTMVNHIHERECSRHLGAQIGFTPHVGQFFQGISITISTHLEPDENGCFPSEEAVMEHFCEYYEHEPLVHVEKAPPAVKDVMKTHSVHVGGFTVDQNTGRLAMICTIDNLLKGAASQAVQNINLALGFEEFEGITLKK